MPRWIVKLSGKSEWSMPGVLAPTVYAFATKAETPSEAASAAIAICAMDHPDIILDDNPVVGVVPVREGS